MESAPRLALVIACCSALLVSSSPAAAVEKTFTGTVSNDWFTAANWAPAGVPADGDDVIVGSGTVDLSGGDATVATYTQTNGTLTGSGGLTVTGLLTWQRGALRGTGVVHAQGGLAMAALSTLTLADTRTLNNTAIATWTGPGNFSLEPNATFNNLAGATFQIDTAADMGAGHFNNQGIVTKHAGGSGDGVTTISSIIDDRGAMTISSGTLGVSNAGTHAGNMIVEPGAAFRFMAGTHIITGSLTSADTVGFDGGTVTFAAGSVYSVAALTKVSGSNVSFAAGSRVTLSDSLRLDGGTLDLSSGTDFHVASYAHDSGTLTGSDDLTVDGPMTWASGIIRGSATLNANGGIAMTAVTTINLSDTRILNNLGEAVWSGSGNFSLGSNAVFNNLAGGTFRIATSADMGSGTLNNFGTMSKESGNADGVTSLSSIVVNHGIVEILGGTLVLGSTYDQLAGVTRLNGGALGGPRTLRIHAGSLEGAGSVDAAVVVDQQGVLSPGLSPGAFQLMRSYAQADRGDLALEIGGTQPGSTFDVVAIGGAAALGGKISARLVDGFIPSIGESFEVLTFASHTGDFEDDSALVLGGGFGFRRVLDPSSLTLQYVQEVCGDQQDNDADGKMDCQDPKCGDVPTCLVSPTPTSSPTPMMPVATPTIDCVGDCQGDRVVTVDEILIGVSVALGVSAVDQCPVFDFNGDRQVTVDEILTSLRQALEGCPRLAAAT